MTFKSFHIGIIFRITILTGILLGFSFLIIRQNLVMAGVLILLAIFSIYDLFKFLSKRFEVIDDFFEAIKYRDFSRNYLTENKTKDIARLYRGFNQVNKTVRQINSEKEAQYLYLQKILEMIDIGILAFNVEEGNVLWSNDSFQNSLNFPDFKNISFIKSRSPELYEVFSDNYYSKPTTLKLKTRQGDIKVLLSNSLFRIDDESYKLIVIHNIEDTLNKTESDAWKKLLSVMTHEIMNSIAPISSLANTLKTEVRSYQEDTTRELDIEDLDAGLASIEKRSDGLMKFAKTYRSLNKVTSLSLESIKVKALFRDIEYLISPSIVNSDIDLKFTLEDEDLEVDADAYLLEQVLINLLLNAVEACEHTPDARVHVFAQRKIDGKCIIKIADNGPGIDEEIKEQVFIPFFTTKETGSGVGLSLSKQIMTLHGGKIQIEKNHLGGTTIILVF